MLPTQEPHVVSALRKFRPQAKLPAPDVLAELSEAERSLLSRRLREVVECVTDPIFGRADAENELMRLPLELPTFGKAASADDSGLGLVTDSAATTPASDAEQRLFLRLNYCRYRVLCILRQAGTRPLSAAETRELLAWEQASVETRGEIVRVNLPLVLAMAKRTKVTGVDPCDLISEGNLALMRSVDKFDCRRGYRFSTYACRAILKSFSRVATRTSRHRSYFPTEFDPTLERGDSAERRRAKVEGDCVDELKSILGQNLADLTDVEQTVIRARFALEARAADADVPRVKTLEQVGEMIGVTKERVRQIQNKALAKLRTALDQGLLSA
jgi:RNA polymerase sigma factor (sigma-70 family)